MVAVASGTTAKVLAVIAAALGHGPGQKFLHERFSVACAR